MTATPRGAPETDDSENPTSASPDTPSIAGERPAGAAEAGDSDYVPRASSGSAADDPAEGSRDLAPESGRERTRRVQFGSAEVFGQVQGVVQDLSRQARPLVRQATPILRELAAKAAELAAVVAENAGPAARRAAELTQDLGTRVAARSREVASDLRRAEERDFGSRDETDSESIGTAGSDADRAGTSASSRSREGTQRPPATPGL